MTIRDLTTKVANNGADASGKLTAEEYNVLLSQLKYMSNGAVYMGIATPTTAPQTYDGNVDLVYIASQSGKYANFGNIVVNDGEICALHWQHSTGWSKEVIPTLLSTKVDKVEGKGLSTNDYTDEEKAEVIISKKNRDIQVASGYYNTAALGSVVSAKTESSGYVCAIVPALVGSTYEFAGIGTTGAAQLIFTLDRNMKVMRNANSLGVAANTSSAQLITIQEGEKYIGYNSTVGGYNSQGIFRLCDNVVNVEEILRNELRKIEESGDNAPNDISVSGWIDGRYLYRDGLPNGISDNYKCTDFIAVQPLRKIRITNAFTTDYSAVHFYDNAQMHVGRLEKNEQTGVFSGDVDIPANCRYIRYSIKVTQLTTNAIEYIDTKPNYYLSNKLVNGWFEQSYQKTETLFKSAADRPILTIIDDDTPSSEGINRLVGLCDELGVKCTFATLTRQFELHPEMPDTIKALERRGYHFAIHGYSQHSAYQNADNNVAICEDDLVRGLQDMRQAGAMDFKYWVTPFGAQSDTMKRLAKKWGMNCMITTKEGVETTRASQGKWAITRCGLNRTDAESDITLEGLKGLIDECVSVNGWILLCTHIANGWSDNDYSRFNEIVNYAKNAGCDIMPLNEAWNKRKPIYDFYEVF